MTLMFTFNKMEYHTLTLLITFYFFCVSKGENNSMLIADYTDERNRQLDFIDFCRTSNLRVLAYSDSEKKIIPVSFELSDPKFRDCFTHYDIFLEKGRRVVDSVKIKYIYDEVKRAVHVFENVSCGIYELVIQPCFNDWQCAPRRIRYPKSLNVSSNECLLNIETLSSKLEVNESIGRNVIIMVAVLSAISVFSVIGLIYYYFTFVKKTYQKDESEACENGNFQDDHVDSTTDTSNGATNRKICLFIFHFYDQNGEVKKQVEILRDFLSHFSCFSTIKVLDDELARIHINPKVWLNRALEREAEDGSLIKFIIIDFEEEFEEEGQYRFENLLYQEIIDTIDNDRKRSLLGHDSLYIVRLSGIRPYSKRLAHFVMRERYHIPDPHQLVDLCVNICSGTGFNENEVTNRVRQLFWRHPIQDLGLVQHSTRSRGVQPVPLHRAPSK